MSSAEAVQTEDPNRSAGAVLRRAENIFWVIGTFLVAFPPLSPRPAGLPSRPGDLTNRRKADLHWPGSGLYPVNGICLALNSIPQLNESAALNFRSAPNHSSGDGGSFERRILNEHCERANFVKILPESFPYLHRSSVGSAARVPGAGRRAVGFPSITEACGRRTGLFLTGYWKKKTYINMNAIVANGCLSGRRPLCIALHTARSVSSLSADSLTTGNGPSADGNGLISRCSNSLRRCHYSGKSPCSTGGSGPSRRPCPEPRLWAILKKAMDCVVGVPSAIPIEAVIFPCCGLRLWQEVVDT